MNRNGATILLLLAATLACYGASLANGFAWDDEQIVVNNPATRDLGQVGRVMLSPDETPPYYRPLNRASYLVDYALFGMRPAAFHAVNVALHAACVLALYALGLVLWPGRRVAIVPAMLLAVHPIHAEAVNFVTARNNLLALLFALLALVLFAKRRPWLSGLALFLGLMSKEPAAMVLPLLVAWPWIAGADDEDARPAARVRAYLPHALAVALYAVLRVVALGRAVGAPHPATGLLGRLAVDVELVPAYLRLVLFPRDLTIFHEPTASAGWVVAGWTLLAAAVVFAVRRRSPAAWLGLLWFGLNLLPIANLVPIPSALMAERYFHAAAVGLWILAGDAVAALVRPGRRAAWTVAVGAIVLVALGARTAARTLDWRDDVRLASRAVAVDPGSNRAWFNLGVALKDRGDLAGARRAWEAALRIRPGDGESRAQLGTLAAVQGDLGTAERQFRDALAADPRLAIAHFNLGLICERTGRVPEAIEHYRAVVAIHDPLYREYTRGARERLGILAKTPEDVGVSTMPPGGDFPITNR